MASKEVKSKFGIYLAGGGRGSINVYDDGIELSVKSGRIIPKNYIVEVNKLETRPLNKVYAELVYYDYTGNKESDKFSINENDFRVLKKLIGK